MGREGRTTEPSPRNSPSPHGSRAASQGSRVGADDELSSTQEAEARPGLGYQSPNPLWRDWVPTQPAPPPATNYVGIGPNPLQHREGGTPIRDAEVLRILHSQQVTQSTRPEAHSYPSSAMVGHTLPISSGASASARQNPQVTLPVSSSSGATSFDRFRASVDLMTTYRESRRQQREQGQDTTADFGQTGDNMEQGGSPATAPAAPETSAQPAASPFNVAAPVFVPPTPTIAIYEGLDEDCTICACPFQHGERVCRLACRHMFHTGCWERYMTAASTRDEYAFCCPNCRGGHSIIAI